MIFILLLIALGLCFASNRDVFSPGKFYHAYLLIFFVDIFLSEQLGYIYVIYLGFIFGGMLFSMLEASVVSSRQFSRIPPKRSWIVPPHFTLVLWLLSVVPLLSQLYLIHCTGGFASLARVISHRVVEWRGMGALLMLITLISPINVVYFAIGLISIKRRAGVWWALYVAHLLLFAVIAALQGSRGFILGQVLLMMVAVNYLRGPIKLRSAFIGGAVLLVSAALLGAIRNNLTALHDLDSLKDMRGGIVNLKMFSYGIDPLNTIFADDFSEFQYGKTFLTPLTNYVPRQIWPEKFESGGVVLTKFWLGYDYTGLTHMSPGIVAESILNFGYPVGILWGFSMLALVILLSVRFYGYASAYIHRSSGLTCEIGRAHV